MVSHKKSITSVFDNKELINYIFLGVGLTLFILNLTTLIGFVHQGGYPSMLFNVSVFSSILIILYAVHEINN